MFVTSVVNNDEQFASCACCTSHHWNKEPNVKAGYVSRMEDLVHYGGSTALWPFKEPSAVHSANSQSLDRATTKLLKSYTGFLLLS